MKKTLILLLSLALIFTLAACGEKSGGGSPSENSAPAQKQEAKVYGIGEAAEINGLSITIDKVESPDPDIFINSADDGFAYMQVYYTFKNVSDETIQAPANNSIYIVYKEGPTGDDCDMTSQDDSDIIPGNKDGMYRRSNINELAPGESASGWMMYQRQADKPEVIMHYYSRFINVPAELVFEFTAE
ncbi:MAG: hypothetical protein PHD40_00650 [Syntrophomonadaceae bacterium]|nr:hypothetical protein [Syntrophomonadaceae bacterium]